MMYLNCAKQLTGSPSTSFVRGLIQNTMKPNTTRQTGSTSKSVHPSSFPIFRVDSVTAANVPVAAKEASEVKCTACKCLVHDLNSQRRRTLAESPRALAERLRDRIPSRARLDKMSPFSQQNASSIHSMRNPVVNRS